jgi:hypothetical protein
MCARSTDDSGRGSPEPDRRNGRFYSKRACYHGVAQSRRAYFAALPFEPRLPTFIGVLADRFCVHSVKRLRSRIRATSVWRTGYGGRPMPATWAR